MLHVMNTITLTEITIDGGTQMRADLNEGTVAEYADAMSNGAEFPLIVVFHDGAKYWLADGFHRFFAARQANLDALPADIRQGTRRDAILYAACANTSHGLRRTNADKRKAVMALLEDEEWSRLSDNDIAQRCGVTHPFVGKLRASLVTVTSDSRVSRTVTTKHGTEATMNTSNIGKSGATQESRSDDIRPLAEAGKTAKEIGEELGIADSWVREIAKKHGIEIINPQAAAAAALVENVKALAGEGLTRKEVAERAKIHPDAVSRLCKRHGIKLLTSTKKNMLVAKGRKIIDSAVSGIANAAAAITDLDPSYDGISADEAARMSVSLRKSLKTMKRVVARLGKIQ